MTQRRHFRWSKGIIAKFGAKFARAKSDLRRSADVVPLSSPPPVTSANTYNHPFAPKTKLISQWRAAFERPRFLVCFGVTMAFVFTVGACVVHTLRAYESRVGVPLADPVLALLPVADLSLPIFVIEYGCILAILYRLTTSSPRDRPHPRRGRAGAATSAVAPRSPTSTWSACSAGCSIAPSPSGRIFAQRFPECPAARGARAPTVRDRPGHDRRYDRLHEDGDALGYAPTSLERGASTTLAAWNTQAR